MKNLNKILIITTLLSFSFSFVSADNSDCWTFGKLSYSQEWGWDNWFKIVNESRETSSNRFTNFLTWLEQTRIITKNDLNTAILNLKKYCCENNLWDLTADTCDKDRSFFNDNVPDSPYLFDHLFDVIIRRLKWIDWEENIYKNTKMTLDDKWKNWRERITKEAESLVGSTPQTITDKYQDTWKQSSSNLWYNITTQIYSTFWDLSNQDFLIYVSGWWSTNNANDSEQVANALKNYDKRTLYDRYVNSCALAKYFYWLLDVSTSSSDKWVIIKRTATDSCTWIVQKQIKWENDYVKIITQRSSNLFLANYLEWYISYMYGRQQTLQKLRKDASDRRLDVVRNTSCLQKQCVKDR